MKLTKIRIKNYRLITDAEMDIDDQLTLIVGRNNTGKTSCIDLIEKIINDKKLYYDDYPLRKRRELYQLFAQFIKRKITYEKLTEQLQLTSIEFTIDYSMEGLDVNLGALSPFIIELDSNTTIVKIRVEYRLKADENKLREAFEPLFQSDDSENKENELEIRKKFAELTPKMFEAVIYAVNPNDESDKQIKKAAELKELFLVYTIRAERSLGEDAEQNRDSLGKLITEFFEKSKDDLDPEVFEEMESLKGVVESANREVQNESDEILSRLVNKAVGFGYPNGEELQLGVKTKLEIDDQIKNQTTLAYTSDKYDETLPSTYNGLGYKNLIKIEFLLASFAREIKKDGNCNIPLLFIEEPESHMHPQMQNLFARYLTDFINEISCRSIQVILTSHSSHIANQIDFSKIRYARKNADGVIYKNLNSFTDDNEENLKFIRKYLELTRCDLFFADKAILIEGTSERLLLPDMIQKLAKESTEKNNLSSQYYCLIEVGGAYAHKFIPFMEFLEIPTLIITDIDPANSEGKKSLVSEGDHTTNAAINDWYKRVNNISDSNRNKKKIPLEDIINMSEEEKTIGKCHIEFQTEENGICGHSLEEAIINVNREHFNISNNATEEEITFSGKKTDFALRLINENPNYSIPAYIKNGLAWLDKQKVLD